MLSVCSLLDFVNTSEIFFISAYISHFSIGEYHLLFIIKYLLLNINASNFILCCYCYFIAKAKFAKHNMRSKDKNQIKKLTLQIRKFNIT